MDLIIGGAYQGKLDYAVRQFGLKEDDISTCTDQSPPDWSKRCITRLEEYVYYCLRAGRPCEIPYREDAVLIGRDIFCGVVPMDPLERQWREETGRLFARLSREASTVTRLFCGIPQRLRG